MLNSINFTKIKCENDEQWRNERKNGIGGSDAGSILGFNQYRSPYMLYMEKIGEYEQELSNVECVYWGSTLENVVAKEFERRTGKTVRNCNYTLKSKENPFMLANIDREIVGENAILECKTTNGFMGDEWVGEQVPSSYICQCQHYMAVTGADKAYIACLIGGNKFVWKEILRDDEFIKIMIAVEQDFWENFVLKKEAPLIGGLEAESEFLKRKYPVAEEKVINLSLESLEDIKELQAFKIHKKNYENKINALENKIKNFMGESESGEVGKYTVNWKNQTQKRVDNEKLKLDYPEIYKQILKEISFRKFTIKEND